MRVALKYALVLVAAYWAVGWLGRKATGRPLSAVERGLATLAVFAAVVALDNAYGW